MVLRAIVYSRSSLRILNQLDLPHTESYIEISTVEQAWQSIRLMHVRGAPAIAIVAALSLAREIGDLWLKEKEDTSADGVTLAARRITEKLDYLVTSRPTAVNLADAAKKLSDVVHRAQTEDGATSRNVELAYVLAAEQMLVDDLQDNQNIGRHGADWIMRQSQINGKSSQVSVVTHCNTGYVFLAIKWHASTLLITTNQLPSNSRLRNCSRGRPQPARSQCSQTSLLLRNTALQPGLAPDRIRAHPRWYSRNADHRLYGCRALPSERCKREHCSCDRRRRPRGCER